MSNFLIKIHISTIKSTSQFQISMVVNNYIKIYFVLLINLTITTVTIYSKVENVARALPLPLIKFSNSVSNYAETVET